MSFTQADAWLVHSDHMFRSVSVVAALLAGVLQPSGNPVVYRVETAIAAEPARIWQLLTDLPGYENWNPWVVRAQGQAAPGAEVRVQVMLGSHRMSAQHIVLTVEPEREFCWKDAGWNSWFVYGQRCRTLTRNADGTVLVTNELRLEGALSGVASLAMGKAMRDGMAAENAALREHAER